MLKEFATTHKLKGIKHISNSRFVFK